jgi:hypothetical protein
LSFERKRATGGLGAGPPGKRPTNTIEEDASYSKTIKLIKNAILLCRRCYEVHTKARAKRATLVFGGRDPLRKKAEEGRFPIYLTKSSRRLLFSFLLHLLLHARESLVRESYKRDKRRKKMMKPYFIIILIIPCHDDQ